MEITNQLLKEYYEIEQELKPLASRVRTLENRKKALKILVANIPSGEHGNFVLAVQKIEQFAMQSKDICASILGMTQEEMRAKGLLRDDSYSKIQLVTKE